MVLHNQYDKGVTKCLQTKKNSLYIYKGYFFNFNYNERYSRMIILTLRLA